jgi:hypothetical protein
MRLIDADALCERLNGEMMLESYNDFKQVNNAITQAPTVDPIRHGTFGKFIVEPLAPSLNGHRCSECGQRERDGWRFKYCPNCGAKMDEGSEG